MPLANLHTYELNPEEVQAVVPHCSFRRAVADATMTQHHPPIWRASKATTENTHPELCHDSLRKPFINIHRHHETED